jgi:Cu(I)/Ag(I) efflux system membrane fusion protein
MTDDRNQPEREPALDPFEEGEERAPPGVKVMAIVRWTLVLAMACAAVLSLLYAYGDMGHAEGGRGTQYYCPMHPSVVQDHAGDCPICSMTLVARTSEGSEAPATPSATPHTTSSAGPTASDAAASTTPPAAVAGLAPIALTEQRAQLIGMRTAKATRRSLPSELRALGYVTAPETGLAVIQTRFPGWIEELLVSQTGQQVQRGQLLARVYSPELFAAQQELLNARRWSAAEAGPKSSESAATGGAALDESARARLELMGMHPAEIAEVIRTGTPHRSVEIRSPVKGYVAQKNAVQGLYFQPGSRLFDLADLSKVWVMVELFERDAGRIKAGQTATLQLTAYPGETFRGKVRLVYPTLNAETRTQRARVDFNNADLRLRPGMFGEVVIQQGTAEGLVIPREALVDTGEQQYVFVAEKAGRYVPRVVRVGMRLPDQVQVLSGLADGETVVTTGNFLLDSESRLRAAIEGAPKAGASSP